jgi:hypothetical protein
MSLSSSPILADPVDNNGSCSGNMALTQQNEFRSDAGPIQGPITTGSVGLKCRNFDAFMWGVHSNNTGKVSEVDVGLRYSFSLSESGVSGRGGVERWNYLENGASNDVLVGSIDYTFPLDLNVGI